MKKIATISALALSIVIVSIVACSNPKLKMLPVKARVFNNTLTIDNPNSELALAKKDSIANYKKFRADAIAKLSRNISKISNYRTAIDSGAVCDNKVVCETTADSLTDKNNELIVKLDNGKADKNWNKFKRQFKSDLDKLSFVIGNVTKPDKE